MSKSLKKGTLGSASTPALSTADAPMVEAYAASSMGVDRTTNIHSQGGGVSINVNINTAM